MVFRKKRWLKLPIYYGILFLITVGLSIVLMMSAGWYGRVTCVVIILLWLLGIPFLFVLLSDSVRIEESGIGRQKKFVKWANIKQLTRTKVVRRGGELSVLLIRTDELNSLCIESTFRDFERIVSEVEHRTGLKVTEKTHIDFGVV